MVNFEHVYAMALRGLIVIHHHNHYKQNSMGGHMKFHRFEEEIVDIILKSII